MTDTPEGEAPHDDGAARPTLQIVVAFVTLMVVIILPQFTGQPIPDSQPIAFICLGAMFADVTKLLALLARR